MLVDSDKNKIIRYILNNPETPVKIVSVAGALRISKGYVSKVVEFLEDEGIVKSKLPDLSNPYVRALKTLYNVDLIVEQKLPALLKRQGISSAGVYGSWANGTNNEESDFDLWIKPKKHVSEAEVSAIYRQLRQILGTNPQIVLLSPERLQQIKKTNAIFYYSLVFNSILLFGEPLERA